MKKTLALLLVLSFPLTLHAPRPTLHAPATLTYIESSTGLDVPRWEAGRTEVELADVNGDGHPDIVSIGDHGSPYVGTQEHGIMVWFGDGAGVWSVYQSGDFGYGGIALGDVNNDGLMDAGYAMHHNYSGSDFGDQLIEVALGDGSGQNWTPWDDGLATNGEDWGMFANDFADINLDGLLDIASLSFGCCNGVHVYLNHGDGTWSQSFATAGGNSHEEIVFGDVNADGRPDFAASDEPGTVYLGDGVGGFTLADGNLPPSGFSGRPGPDLGDVNGDGRDDLSFCSASGGTQVWAWAGNNTWQNFSGNLPGTGACAATQLADMNVDGFTDVVTFGARLAVVWGGDGAGNWTMLAAFSTPSPGNYSALRVGGDGDHNGYPDIVIVAEEGGGLNPRNHLRFFKEASAPTALSVTPVFPRGGETFVPGSVRFVDWLSAAPGGATSTLTLELSTTGPGGPWTPIAVGLPDNGRYQWLLPADLPQTSDAYLRYTVTDGAGNAAAITPAAFTIAGPARPTVHVADIRLGARPFRGGYLARGLVTIRDQDGQAVAGAAVRAALGAPDGSVRRRQAVTDASGVARFLWGAPVGGTWVLCVEDVTRPGYQYDPGQNAETCDQINYP